MLGNKLWASLTSDFKIEIQGNQEEYKFGHEYDGPKLWDYIRRRVNPTTTVGASRLKDMIESANLCDFSNDVIKFNTWQPWRDFDIPTLTGRELGAHGADAPFRISFVITNDASATLPPAVIPLQQCVRQSAETNPQCIAAEVLPTDGHNGNGGGGGIN